MNKLLSVIMSIAVAAALLSGSIAAPILVRGFYYAQIAPLNLEEASGLSEAEIRNAYDEVLDYCTGKSDEFSAGVLPFSDEGASHFADCRKLFILDFEIFGVSLLLIAALTMYRRRRGLHEFCGRSPAFWGAAGICGAICAAAALAATDFDRAFEVFHGIFFPGKDNWIFAPKLDPIIKLMPEAFFRNCAILIALLIALVSAIIIISDLRKKKSG